MDMDMDKIQSYILNDENHDTIDIKLNILLSIIRKHLGMSVSFISEFVDGERVFRYLDTENKNSHIKVGDSDPLDETYCKKIVDNKLTNVICDTSKNIITSKLDVTDKLSIGSYLGVPITLSSGEVYGTFCCYKNCPDNTLNQNDLSYLRVISEIASNYIEENIASKNIHRESKKRIQSVLDEDKIIIHYQPIFNIQTNQIAGFESLSRFNTETYRTPDIWFKEASQVGMGEKLEIAAIVKAIKGLNELDSNTYISVNTSPEYILNGAIANVLQNIDTNRIVLEITEHSPVSSYSDLRLALEPLRKKGVRLAIDDAGAGYSSFQHILELEADIIKLDISLTQNIHSEPRKYLLAKALCAFAKSIKCTIIAEGIETDEELNSLRGLGIDLIQGYLLGRPMPIEEAISHKSVA
ncbi:MAG: EAL domain-containing protein [Gammaproteobacteria bacterium]|nr:EAL domain-containing protein [Gammaproteobacteria bacterium]MDH5629229.1 EAL domain-containing protein [Gammaproteobacteria bacterium]